MTTTATETTPRPPMTDRAKAVKASTQAVLKAEQRVEKKRADLAEAERDLKVYKQAARELFGE